MVANALTIQQYLRNKTKRANASFLSGNVKKWIIDGEFYTDEELNQKYPIHLRILRSEDLRLHKGFNKDKTKIER
jgi:hypothetical protein